MTTHGDFSPQARARAQRTTLVAEVFGAYAERIVAELPDVPEGHVLVAVVDSSQEFSGTHRVDRSELVERIAVLEDGGGWAMVFSPGTSVEDVRRRAADMGSIAAQRAAAIDRIARRTNPPDADLV
jgi:hypothetical protein